MKLLNMILTGGYIPMITIRFDDFIFLMGILCWLQFSAMLVTTINFDRELYYLILLWFVTCPLSVWFRDCFVFTFKKVKRC